MSRKKKIEGGEMGIGEAAMGAVSGSTPAPTAPEAMPVAPEEVKSEWVVDESLVGMKHCGKVIVSSEMKADGSFYRFKDQDGSSYLFGASEVNPEKRLIQP